MIETVTLRPQVENIHGAFRPQEPRGAPCGPGHVVRLLSMWNTLSVRRGREKTCQYLGHVSSNAKLSLTTVWLFCVNFWVTFEDCLGKRYSF